MALQIIKFSAGSKPREVAPRTFRFVASDGTRDRDGDVIVAAGWDLTSFLKNPTILVGHDRSSLPVARAARVWVDGSRLMVDVEFPPEGTSKAADEAYALVAGGYLRAVSVGFLPLAKEPLPDGGGYRFTRAELCEISLVSVPSNPEAVLAARLGGKPRPEPERVPLTKAAVLPHVQWAVQVAVQRAVAAEIRKHTGRLD